MDWAYGGSSWSETRRHEFLCAAMNELDTTESLLNSLLLIPSPEGQKILQSEAYVKGVNDGVAVIGAAYGKLIPNEDDPLDMEAMSLAKKLQKELRSLHVAGDDADANSGALSSAYMLLTIMKHIQDNWIDE